MVSGDSTSESEQLTQSDEPEDTRSITPQELDLSRPITSARETKATPRRYTPVMRLIGDQEARHIPSNEPRNRRVFLFNPQGRAVSLEINPKWKNLGSLCAAATAAFYEPSLTMVPQAPAFTYAYFYPSMADVDDLDDIRENDQIVVVPSKLEHGQQLNALGSTRGRSSSISGLPAPASPRVGQLQSEWSNIVPVVESSFFTSTKTFETHTTLETERFSSEKLEQSFESRQRRIRSDHLSDIFKHIESYALLQDTASQSLYSMEKSASRPNFSGSSVSLPAFEIPPTTPRGGISVPPKSTLTSAMTPPTVSVLTSPTLSKSPPYASSPLGTSSLIASDSLSEASDSGFEMPIVISPSSTAAQQCLGNRQAFEWERSENEMRAMFASHILPDKWEERDKSKKEKSRLLSADEERFAKKMEKRQSKVKVQPQKGVIGALGTMPRTRPDTPSRSATPSLENLFDSPEDILTDANGKLIAMKLDRLIQRLTSDSFPAVSLAKSFLLSYRLYMSPIDLVNALDARWDADGPPTPEANLGMTPQQMQQMHLTPSRLRLLTLAKQWAFKHGTEDFDNVQVRDAFFTFAAKMERCGVVNLTKEIEMGLFKKRGSVVEAAAAQDMDIEETPKNSSSFVPPIGGELFDFHPLELARQITLLEKSYLDSILPQELLNLAWTKKNKETLAPNVLSMIRFSNFLVDWMCTEIIKPNDALERAMVLNRFIYVGHYCAEMNNFNGVVEVLSALRRSSVYRLRKSWNHLSDRAWNIFEQLERIFEPDSNFKNYRVALEKAIPPCVPYVGRLLSDILFLEEKEPTTLGAGEMVNLVKLEAMGSILKFLTDHQHHDYRFTPIEIIVSYLYSRDVYNEKQAYNISLDREKKVTEPSKRTSELSPSSLQLEDCATRSDVFTLFRNYLEGRIDVNLLVFYKQVADWGSSLKAETEQTKRTRELALLIFDAFIGDRSDQYISFPKDAFLMATTQEIEWKVRDDSMPLSPTLFKPLIDSILPVLQYHFDLFKRSLTAPIYEL